MNAELLYAGLRLAAQVLAIAGLVLAEFAGAQTFGFILVLIAIASAGGAVSAFVIVRQERRANPNRMETST